MHPTATEQNIKTNFKIFTNYLMTYIHSLLCNVLCFSNVCASVSAIHSYFAAPQKSISYQNAAKASC